MNFITVIIILLNILEFEMVFSDSQCSKIKKCGECVGFAKTSCYWCLADEYEGNRCDVHEELLKKCKDKIYPNNKLKLLEIVKSDNFSSDMDNVVQVKPQHLKIHAYPGTKTTLQMLYKAAKDYPIDIYYLIDNSFSMSEHKNMLASEGKRIPESLSSISNNVYMGVGTFIEKPAIPYAQHVNNAYSYQNHVSLTNDMDRFTNAILNMRSGSNLDDPEAGFDGLMQAMVCKKQVGWRNTSRKIIVVATDNTYHSAGDGKIVGAFKRNDMVCHTKDTGYYIDELLYDYPSVSQINMIAVKHGFVIIFAATASMKEVYQNLTNAIKWSIYAELQENSNIVEIIEKEYTKLTQSLQLITMTSNNIDLKLTPNCLEQGNEDCKIEYKQVKNINVTIEIKDCLAQPEFVEISTQTGDKLIIEVESICNCECEKKGMQKNSMKCSSNGTLECGICKCNENRSGHKCECDVTTSFNKNYMNKCKMNGNNTETCSGRGVCSCGVCVSCDKGFSGPFCQYDEQRCRNSEGELCSNNGKCFEGKCICDEDGDWSGDYCNCQNQKCIAPYSKEVCSGRGVCDCGKCVCNKNLNNGTYLGLYCDNCENCAESRCIELNKYIMKQCEITRTHNVSCKDSDNHTLTIVDKKSLLTLQKAKWCSYVLENGCSIVYKFKYVSGKLEFIVQDIEECPHSANIWIPIGAAIGSILLIGLVTAIIWKILVDIHDKKEYEKFVKESSSALSDTTSENPLYRRPEINFINPAFQSTFH